MTGRLDGSAKNTTVLTVPAAVMQPREAFFWFPLAAVSAHQEACEERYRAGHQSRMTFRFGLAATLEHSELFIEPWQ